MGNENSAVASCFSDEAGDENKYAASWGGQEMANDLEHLQEKNKDKF